MITDEEDGREDIEQIEEIELVKQTKNVDSTQMKGDLKITEDSKKKCDEKFTKKCKLLCSKKELNSKSKKHKAEVLKHNSDKTNSMETECVDMDDLASAENEQEENEEKQKLKNLEKHKNEIDKMNNSFAEEIGVHSDTQQHMELGQKPYKNKERKTKKKLKETTMTTEQRKECMHECKKNIINDMEIGTRKNYEKREQLEFDETLKENKFQKEDARKSNEWFEKNDKLEVNLNKNEAGKMEISVLNTMQTGDSSQNGGLCGTTQLNEKPSIRDFLYVTLCNPGFICASVILTAYSVIIQNNLVYGAPLVYALKIYPSYEAANVTCSLCACVSSVVGTCVGGVLVDIFGLNIQKIDKNYEHIKANEPKIKLYEQDILVYKYLKTIGLLSFAILTVASVVFLVQPFVHSMYPFTALMTAGFTLFFATMSAINIAVMVCVPDNFRPFAMGISTFITHALGDIPWTVIVGKIKSTLAPDCYITKDEVLAPQCDEQKDGLTWTLFIICSKILIMTFGSLVFFIYAHHKIQKIQKKQQSNN